MATKSKNHASIPQAYLRLLGRFLLRPLKSEEELTAATALVTELFDRTELLPGEQQYLDVLCDLVEAFEDVYHPIGDVSPAAMLRYLIDQRGVTQLTISRETGVANSTITALLKGDREMTRSHLETFARYFGVEPAVFLPAKEAGESAAQPPARAGSLR